MTPTDIKKLVGHTVVYNCNGRREIVVEGVDFIGRNKKPIFLGMCVEAEYKRDVGMGVWDYVDLIKEIRCTECGELIDERNKCHNCLNNQFLDEEYERTGMGE
jgi:hypothetical protein